MGQSPRQVTTILTQGATAGTKRWKKDGRAGLRKQSRELWYKDETFQIAG